MARIKTFFIYFLLVVAFFLFSQIMIYVSIYTTYAYKAVEIKTAVPMQAIMQATSINGIIEGKINNKTNQEIQNQYLKIECYSKHDVLMGRKYIKIDSIAIGEEREFEVRFNYHKVERAAIDIVGETEVLEQNIAEAEKQLGSKQGLAIAISALVLLCFL